MHRPRLASVLERGARDFALAVRADGISITTSAVVAGALQVALLYALQPVLGAALSVEGAGGGWRLLLALAVCVSVAGLLELWLGAAVGVVIISRGEGGPRSRWAYALRSSASLVTALMGRGFLWSAGPLSLGLALALGVRWGDENLQAAVWVLFALYSGLVCVVVGVALVARFGLAWPVIALERASAREALHRARIRGHGARLLLLSLAADAVGVFGLGFALLAFAVPSPGLSDVSQDALYRALPELVSSQAILHGAAAALGVGVAAFAATTARALYDLTAEG